MPVNDPRELPDSVVLAQFAGLKNTVAETRLQGNELVKAINVDVDDAGQLRRRRGYARVATGSFHSLFQSHNYLYGVKDGVLGIIYPNYTFEALKTGIGADRLSFVDVGSVTYYSSRSASGRILPDKSVASWGAVSAEGEWLSPVVTPTDYLGEVAGKIIAAPPMADCLTHYNGRIYLAAGTVLWATELFLYNYVDVNKNFLQFEHEITCLSCVGDGIYVGTTEAIYFLSGTFPLKRDDALPYGAIPGSMISVPADLVRPQTSASRGAVLFLTDQGLCVGLDGGICHNMTRDRVLFPRAASAATMLRQQDGINQIVSVMEHGGTPGSSARFGDYVDAEIRRFQG